MKNNSDSSEELIARLVKERSSFQPQAGDKASPRLFKKQQEWNMLKTQPLYLLSLTVKVGMQSIKLEGDHLGISKEVMDLLEDSAKGGYRASTSQRIKDAANKLQARQKIIYNQFTVLSEPFRLVHEASLPEALGAIEEMIVTADQLRQEIVFAYEEEFTAFLSWAYQVLRQANLESAVLKSALTSYADHYPTQEDFRQCLQVVVEGPIKIPSLIEDTQTQVIQAKEQAAATVVKQELEKLNIIRRSQETLEQTLLSTLYDAQTRSRDEAYDKLAELLESFTISGEAATSRTGQKWIALQNRLHTLAQFDTSLSPIVQQTAQIEQMLLSKEPDLHNVQVLLDNFRAILIEQIKKESSGAGVAHLAKALAFDFDYNELLKQLDAIADTPSPEEFQKLKGKLAAMEGVLRNRSKSLKDKWEQAEKAVRVRMGLSSEKTILTPFTKEDEPNKTLKGNNNPYDEDAGF